GRSKLLTLGLSTWQVAYYAFRSQGSGLRHVAFSRRHSETLARVARTFARQIYSSAKGGRSSIQIATCCQGRLPEGHIDSLEGDRQVDDVINLVPLAPSSRAGAREFSDDR